MSKDKLYQLSNQNEFEIVFEEVTLETAFDITYTKAEIAEHFFGGEMPDRRPDSGWLSANWSDQCFLNKDAIRSAVVRGLSGKTKTKGTYMVDVGDEVMATLENHNSFFKEANVMYSPSKQYFVHYRHPKVKVKVKDGLFNSLRQRATYTICCVLREIGGFDIEFKYVNDKESQVKVVAFAKKVGLTKEQILSFEGKNVSWLLKGLIDETVAENDDSEMLTLDAFYEWFDNSFDPPAQPE